MSTTPIQTPRTDAVWLSLEDKSWPVSLEMMHDHADLLEKELTAAQRTLSEQAGRIGELEALLKDAVRIAGTTDENWTSDVQANYDALTSEVDRIAALQPPPAKPEAKTQQENPAKQNRSPEGFA